ncbi:MAG: YidC/Oxa1 family membrane protein insertase [Candidatus Sungbacteria bacterium]|uniref:YidC/Oxa1 family membrane protein insertase n=1 Tax=Candidatus Sungiibacteriota bacterium TaxID=2750080 RepID=A0A9D6QYG2_9BACT|nr:YidC/Oxa1 family membrane protein insertase [Candidatus Sungbacteria bacterium]
MIGAIYNEILYRPLANILVFFYAAIPYHDLGLSIILLTIVIRLLLYPFIAKQMKAQKQLSAIQPALKKIQDQYKDNKEEQAKKVMELYKSKGVNPASGCLPLLIQLPLLIALYQVFRQVSDPAYFQTFLGQLYSFVPHPTSINPTAFGFINLAHTSIVLGILAAATQFFQGYVMTPSSGIITGEKKVGTPSAGDSFQKALQMQTLYMLPIIIFIFSIKFAAALPLYWVTLNVFGIIQQVVTKIDTPYI